jgi:alpha-beta hydrolase superfamily lysophospholipase
LLPRLKGVKLDSTSISRDAEVAAACDSDPLVYRECLCARTGAEINAAVKQLQAAMEQATLPFLILHGSEDRLSGPDGSRQFHARARSDDKSLKMYAGFYHEVFNEPEKQQVLADLTEWLQARV